MKKGIYLVDADEVVDKLCKEIDQEKERFRERMMFLQKSAANEHDKFVKANKPRWDQLEERLKELGKLPKDYESEKQKLQFDLTENIIFLNDQDAGSFAEFIQSILN